MAKKVAKKEKKEKKTKKKASGISLMSVVNVMKESYPRSKPKQLLEVCKDVFKGLGVVLAEAKPGEKLSINGFGSFRVVETKPRKGRNPKTGETIKIGAKKAVRVKISPAVKKNLNA